MHQPDFLLAANPKTISKEELAIDQDQLNLRNGSTAASSSRRTLPFSHRPLCGKKETAELTGTLDIGGASYCRDRPILLKN